VRLSGQIILAPANINRPGTIVCLERLADSCASITASRPERPDRVFGPYDGQGLCPFPYTRYLACSAKISFDLTMRKHSEQIRLQFLLQIL
jgi:hypothetical protein